MRSGDVSVHVVVDGGGGVHGVITSTKRLLECCILPWPAPPTGSEAKEGGVEAGSEVSVVEPVVDTE